MSPIALLSHWLDLCPKRHAPLQDERLERRPDMIVHTETELTTEKSCSGGKIGLLKGFIEHHQQPIKETR